MKSRFVADGRWRFWRGRRNTTTEAIGKKYAAELEKASPAEKIQIQEQIAAELLRREKSAGHKPSPATLW